MPDNKGIRQLWGYDLIDSKARNAISDTRSSLENDFQKKTDDTLGTTSKTVPGAINEIKDSVDNLDGKFSVEQTDTKYDMKYNGKTIANIGLTLTDDQIAGGDGSFNIDLTPYQTKTDTSLTTNNKTISGAIKELNTQYKDIANTKADKNSVFTMANMGQDIKEAMTGGSVAVVGKNAILNENIVNHQINYYKTDFIELGTNLFNEKTVSEKGWWANTVTGEPETNQYTATYCYSDYILVEPNTIYTRSSDGNHSYCIYDENKNFISGAFSTSGNITTPENARYIRLTIIYEYLKNYQFQKGEKITEIYPYELKIKDLDVTRKFNDSEENINEIPYLKKGINNIKISLEKSFDLTSETDLIEFKPAEGWKYLTSIFSGWSSCIGKPTNFNIVIFKIRSRSEKITRVKVYLQEDSADGKILAEEMIDVNVEPNEECKIQWELPTIIENNNKKNIQFTYQANKLCDAYLGEGVLGEEYPNTRYSVNGEFKKPSDMTVVEGAKQIIWTQTGLKRINYSISDEKIKSAVDKEIGKDAFDNSFNLINSFNIIDSNGNNPSENYATSTFSGWGGHIGTFEKIECLKFSVRNRDTKPTTTIKCFITEFNKTGNILAEGTINVNIPIGERQDVIWKLDESLINSENKKLYFSYMCDTIITKVCILLDGEGDNKTYGWSAYTTGGNLNKSPSELVDVYSSTGSSGKNSIWCEIGEYKKIYKPTKNFISYIENSKTTSDSCRVVLPDVITAVVGDNLQLFYRGLIEAVNPYNYDIRVRCIKGKAYSRYFEFKPIAKDVGEYDFSISVYNNETILLAESKCKLKVVDVGNSPTANKTILCVGDSLTNDGYWCSEARRRLIKTGGNPVGHNKTNIEFIGSKSDSSGCKWEGYGGWTWDSYLAEPDKTKSDIWLYCTHDKTEMDQHSIWKDANGYKWSLETIETNRLKFTRYQGHTNPAPSSNGILTHVENAVNTSDINFTDCKIDNGNPFWDNETNRVNFQKYCQTHGFEGIDYVYTLLTWNGGRVDKFDIDSNKNIIESAKKFIDILHQDYPNAKVRIMGIQLPSINGGTGANYGANGGYSDTYGLIRGVFGLNLAYQKFANDSKYNDFVEFVNVSGQFDSDYNMPYNNVQVNNRNTITEMRGTNGVHPSINGYLQIGDVAYRSLVKDLLV